jgi:hypothetical protein
VCAECSILNTIAACSLSNFEQSASANEQIPTPAKLKRLVGLRAVSIWMGGDPMLIPDYIAISVLTVLALWAGVKRFP